jgi:hypothetical protein
MVASGAQRRRADIEIQESAISLSVSLIRK